MPAAKALAEAGRRLGLEVDQVEISSNEDLAAELASAPGRFDVVFPSDYLVERLVSAGSLAELDHSALPVGCLEAWARECRHDPGCRWSVPFAFGTTGILASDGFSSTSWHGLLDPAGPVAMLNEVREVYGAALIAAGRGPNDLDQQALSGADALLKGQRPYVVGFDSDDFVSPVASGRAVAGQAWSGPASAAVRERAGLHYIVPNEGAILWVTTAAVPADAPDLDRAIRLLRALMEPELAAITTASNGYATPNREARAMLPRELRDDPILFPDASTRKSCFTLEDCGEREGQLAGRWEQLRAG